MNQGERLTGKIGMGVGITEGVELGGFDNATYGSPVRGRVRIELVTNSHCQISLHRSQAQEDR